MNAASRIAAGAAFAAAGVLVPLVAFAADAPDVTGKWTMTVETSAGTGKVVFGGFGEGTFKGTRARPAQP